MVQQKGIFGLIDYVLGGAFSMRQSLTLGLMPYHFCIYVLQYVTVGVASFRKCRMERGSLRNESSITRVLTILITNLLKLWNIPLRFCLLCL